MLSKLIRSKSLIRGLNSNAVISRNNHMNKNSFAGLCRIWSWWSRDSNYTFFHLNYCLTVIYLIEIIYLILNGFQLMYGDLSIKKLNAHFMIIVTWKPETSIHFFNLYFNRHLYAVDNQEAMIIHIFNITVFSCFITCHGHYIYSYRHSH